MKRLTRSLSRFLENSSTFFIDLLFSVCLLDLHLLFFTPLSGSAFVSVFLLSFLLLYIHLFFFFFSLHFVFHSLTSLLLSLETFRTRSLLRSPCFSRSLLSRLSVSLSLQHITLSFSPQDDDRLSSASSLWL